MSGLELMAVIAGVVIGFVIVSAVLGQRGRGATPQAQAEPDARGTTKDTHYASSEPHDAGEGATAPQVRIFQCPHCSQRMRVQIPLIGRNSQCKRCGTKFAIGLDEHGNLHVVSNGRSKQHHDGEHDTPATSEECLALLGLGPIATSEEIKAAYKKQMKDYHPDKVAHLGEKLRAVAGREAQKLNSAYGFLKERGFLKDA